MIDVVDGAFCTAASSLDYLGIAIVEIEVACWVNQRVGLVASD